MCAKQPSLQQRGNPMHQGRRVLSWLTRLFFHNGVVITAQTSRRVSLPLIGPDSTSRFNHFVHCVPQRHGVGIRDDFDANATNTCLSFVFDGYQYQYLSESASSSFSRPNSAKEYLIDLDESAQSFATGTNHGSSNPL